MGSRCAWLLYTFTIASMWFKNIVRIICGSQDMNVTYFIKYLTLIQSSDVIIMAFVWTAVSKTILSWKFVECTLNGDYMYIINPARTAGHVVRPWLYYAYTQYTLYTGWLLFSCYEWRSTRACALMTGS